MGDGGSVNPGLSPIVRADGVGAIHADPVLAAETFYRHVVRLEVAVSGGRQGTVGEFDDAVTVGQTGAKTGGVVTRSKSYSQAIEFLVQSVSTRYLVVGH